MFHLNFNYQQTLNMSEIKAQIKQIFDSLGSTQRQKLNTSGYAFINANQSNMINKLNGQPMVDNFTQLDDETMELELKKAIVDTASGFSDRLRQKRQYYADLILTAVYNKNGLQN